MAPKKTTSTETAELIKDINIRLINLESIVKYEAVAEVKAVREDVAKLEEALKEYATSERVTRLEKGATWFISIVLGAVLLAIVQLVIRKPE